MTVDAEVGQVGWTNGFLLICPWSTKTERRKQTDNLKGISSLLAGEFIQAPPPGEQLSNSKAKFTLQMLQQKDYPL